MASRAAPTRFDWADKSTWAPALDGARAVYITYFPDLAVPGAAEDVAELCAVARAHGVRRAVLLAGRGEPQVRPAEEAVLRSGLEPTVLECAFFMQNFDEGLLGPVEDRFEFIARDVREPFVDCEDIADVAVAALTEPGDAHLEQTYELTGPVGLRFDEAVAQIAQASGRSFRYEAVGSSEYGEMMQTFLPKEQVGFFLDLFTFLLDGHNAEAADGVERALRRSPTDFATYARRTWGAQR